MKKKVLAIVTAALIGTTAFAATASAASGTIDVISREDGSGTRGAFIELFGIEEKQGDEKVDMTTEDASITNSTSVMMTTVAGDENAIGYISLGSLNDTVKAVKIDGAEASAEGVAMCRDRKRSKALVSATVNPYVLETIKTYCFGNEMKIEVIPEKDGLFIELDVFHGEYEGVLLAEVEFPTEEAANAYTAPDWFGEDVTYSTRYHNSTMSQG